MKFGPRQRSEPTPLSIVLYTKLFIRFMSLCAVILQFIPISEMWKSIMTASIAGLIGGANDVQDWFGVKVKGDTVETKSVDVIADDAKEIKK